MVKPAENFKLIPWLLYISSFIHSLSSSSHSIIIYCKTQNSITHKNLLKHNRRVQDFLSWTLRCCFSLCFVGNPFPQLLHENSFSSSRWYIRMCSSSWLGSAKRRLQILHWWGFDLWSFMWAFKYLKCLSQWEHQVWLVSLMEGWGKFIILQYASIILESRSAFDRHRSCVPAPFHQSNTC